MRKSFQPSRSTAEQSVLLIGGCHGTCFQPNSDDETSRTGRRQFLLVNCIVLMACMAIVALVVALVWI